MEPISDENKDIELSIQIISNAIIKELNKKFDKDFFIRGINNKYGMGDFENVIATCSPNDNKNVLFNVIYNIIDEKIVDEDYFVKCTSNELNECILNELRNINKKAVARTEIFGKRQLEKYYSVQEFSNTYRSNNFLSTIIIDDEISDDDLDNVFNLIKTKYKNLFLKTLIYTIPKEKYDKFYKDSCLWPEITEAIINDYNANNLYIRKIYNNEIIKIK